MEHKKCDKLSTIDKPGLFFFWDALLMRVGLVGGCCLPLFLSWLTVGVGCFAGGGATFCGFDGFSSSSVS